MESLLGTTLPVFIGMTVFVMGFAAFMTGQALANTWQPAWKRALPVFRLSDRYRGADRHLPGLLSAHPGTLDGDPVPLDLRAPGPLRMARKRPALTLSGARFVLACGPGCKIRDPNL
jgi:hypothetical protein